MPAPRSPRSSNSIKQVASLVADIATASTEQSTGIEQINRALTQMDEVTQQNSALVEENAATAKTLEQQSTTMSAEVNVFNLGDDDDVPLAPSAQKPPAAISLKSAAPAKPAMKSAAPDRAPKPAASPRRASVGQMQTALAAAYEDPEWKDF